jgi:hypothetical protein
MVVWWLRTFGFRNLITNWSDGGTEFNTSQLGAFERISNNFWKPLGVKRKLIRKRHPEDNPFIERSHQTDDYEFYIPYLLKAKSELEFIKLAAWWQKVYNTIRTNMGLGDLTPYQKLKSLGYFIPQEFCLFPTLILDCLVNLPDVLSYPESVQDHLDYDHLSL